MKCPVLLSLGRELSVSACQLLGSERIAHYLQLIHRVAPLDTLEILL